MIDRSTKAMNKNHDWTLVVAGREPINVVITPFPGVPAIGEEFKAFRVSTVRVCLGG
jgi:hypothetical protein